MRKTVPILVTILVICVAWVFFKNFTLVGLNQVRVAPKGTLTDPTTDATLRDRWTGWLEPGKQKPIADEAIITEIRDQLPRIRIATFNAATLDHAKANNPRAMDLIARIVRECDILALQGIRSESDNVLPILVGLINKTGQSYDYAIGPRVGPKPQTEQYAFIFNRRTVLLSRSQMYTVDDRSQVLSYVPLVGWFRTVGPPTDRAFTFSLINLRVDPATAIQEHDVLDDLLVAVRDDGRNEDDVILAGDLQAGPGALGPLDQWSDVAFAITQVPTNVAGTAAWDNLVFHKGATCEFTGHSGVLDFLRKYNLTLEAALEVSDHLPVWAEFSIHEGGDPNRVAADPPSALRR